MNETNTNTNTNTNNAEPLKKKAVQKGIPHRHGIDVFIGEIRHRAEQFPELAGEETETYIQFCLDTKGKIIESQRFKKSNQMMVNRYKGMPTDDFKKLIQKQIEAYKIANGVAIAI